MGMHSTLSLLKGIGLGAGLMYLLDPDKGRRRRALLNDQLIHLTHVLEEGIEKGVRDLSNRTYGQFVEARHLFEGEAVDDHTLGERVRARIGRAVGHPGSIDVEVSHGVVTLRGPVLAREVDDLLSAVSSVRGVAGINDELDVHEYPGNVPGLQGEPARARRLAMTPMATGWTPATKLLAGLAAGTLVLSSARRSPLTGLTLGAIGLSLIARGLDQPEPSRPVAARGRPRPQPAEAVTQAP